MSLNEYLWLKNEYKSHFKNFRATSTLNKAHLTALSGIKL